MAQDLSRLKAWLANSRLQIKDPPLFQTITALIDKVDELSLTLGVSSSGGSGTIGGTGTVNTITKFIAPNTIGDSSIFDDGTNIGIGTVTPGAELEINGQIKITGGVPGASKVLTSDVDGLATWETPSSSSDVNRVVATGITRTIIDKHSLVAVDYMAVEGSGILAVEGDGALEIL